MRSTFGRNVNNNYIVFENRKDAGRRLAEKLKAHAIVNKSNTEIQAIPRGGVVIGDIIASILGLNLDIIVSRKIGAPDNPKLALGAQ